MKFKLKYLVAAAAMVAGSSAFAFNNGPDSGGGEMFLNVWQIAGQNGGTTSSSYTLDLQVTYAQFIASKNVNLFINQIVNDTYFSQMLAAASGSLGSLQYSVFGGDRVDTPGIMISTFSGSTAKPSTGTELDSSLSQIANYTGALNATGSYINPAPGGASFNTTGSAYYGNNAGLNTLVGNSSPNSAFVGTKMTVAQFTSAGFTPPPLKDVYGNGLNKFFFGQQSGNYVLQYQVQAVPEPTGYALALAGFGLIGFIARRRKAI